MIKNIYKSYVTTLIGVLFLLGGIAYPFYVKEALIKVIALFIITGFILLFTSDTKIKQYLNKVIDYFLK